MKVTPSLPDFLRIAPLEVRRDFNAAARPMALPSGCPVMSPGQACPGVAFFSAGRVRVFQVGEEGREVTLYHVEAEECCVLTVACLLGSQPYPAHAQAETEIQAWGVTAAVFRDWVARHEFWRDYVFALLGRRLGDVLHRVEDVAFRRIDVRLAAALLRRAGRTGRYVTVTQQQLADELGTAREVISRTLTRFRSAKSLQVARGRIELLDRPQLEALGHRD